MEKLCLDPLLVFRTAHSGEQGTSQVRLLSLDGIGLRDDHWEFMWHVTFIFCLMVRQIYQKCRDLTVAADCKSTINASVCVSAFFTILITFRLISFSFCSLYCGTG